MMKLRNLSVALTTLLACVVSTTGYADGNADSRQQDTIRNYVTRTIQPMMERDGIPGVAVGIIAGGDLDVLNYGVASTKTGQPVSNDTLFEIGSISKTFTATLASYAQTGGHLSLSDPTGKYLP